jgi:hypothetical protein
MRDGRCYGSSLSGYQEYGGLCHMGRFLEDQAKHSKIPRQTGRFRFVVKVEMAEWYEDWSNFIKIRHEGMVGSSRS